MTKDSIENKDSFDMIPTKIRRTVDMKYIGLLSMVASLSFNQGYCKASDEYIIKNTYKMTEKKIRSWLDWLEDNGLIVRYNQLNMVNDEFLRTKRLIVLSDYAYKVYKTVNPKMHEPIECPKGFLLHAEYLKRTLGNQKSKASNNKQRKKKCLNENNQDVANNANDDIKALKRSKNNEIIHFDSNETLLDDIENSFDNKSKPDNVLNKKTLSNEARDKKFIQLCNYYQNRGADNYVEKATKRLKEFEEQLAVRSD